jgi:putative hydrolase
MPPSAPGDAGNPFQSLLGDLMGMLGTNAPDQWEMTRSFGLNVATGGTAEANVEPIARIRLEELARVAELHVIEATGMPVSSDGHRVTCTPIGQGDWTLRALEGWRPIFAAMSPRSDAAGPRPGASSASAPTTPPEDDSEDGLGDLLAKWTSAIGPMFFGLQLGSVIGHLAHRALGQYALGLPWAPSDELVFVVGSITSFAEDWSIPEEEALLWVCARELASHAVLSRPAVRNRMNELLLAFAESSAATQQGLLDRLGGMGAATGDDSGTGMDLESLQGIFGDPEALLGDLLSPETRRSSDQLTSLAVVIDAYADHIADLVGRKLVGSHVQLSEAWYRRRIERGKGEEAAGALFGLDLEPSQVDRGRAFVSGVVARVGDEGLSPLWSSARNLPTPPEVDAPGLWLERIKLPELDIPGASDSE